MTFDSINNSTRDVQAELFKHVVLSGGTTMFPGLPTRLQQELKKRYVDVKLGGNKSRGVCVSLILPSLTVFFTNETLDVSKTIKPTESKGSRRRSSKKKAHGVLRCFSAS